MQMKGHSPGTMCVKEYFSGPPPGLLHKILIETVLGIYSTAAKSGNQRGAPETPTSWRLISGDSHAIFDYNSLQLLRWQKHHDVSCSVECSSISSRTV